MVHYIYLECLDGIESDVIIFPCDLVRHTQVVEPLEIHLHNGRIHGRYIA